MDLTPVLFGEVHEGQDLVLGGSHSGSKLWPLLDKVLLDNVPLCMASVPGLLGEDGFDHGEDDRALFDTHV